MRLWVSTRSWLSTFCAGRDRARRNGPSSRLCRENADLTCQLWLYVTLGTRRSIERRYGARGHFRPVFRGFELEHRLRDAEPVPAQGVVVISVVGRVPQHLPDREVAGGLADGGRDVWESWLGPRPKTAPASRWDPVWQATVSSIRASRVNRRWPKRFTERREAYRVSRPVVSTATSAPGAVRPRASASAKTVHRRASKPPFCSRAAAYVRVE